MNCHLIYGNAVGVLPVRYGIDALIYIHFSGSMQHMFLGGIWYSIKKPPTAECLAPILEEIQSLATEGE